MDWTSFAASNTPLWWIRIFTFTMVLIFQLLQMCHALKMHRDIQIMSLPKFLVLPVHPLDPPPAGDNSKIPARNWRMQHAQEVAGDSCPPNLTPMPLILLTEGTNNCPPLAGGVGGGLRWSIQRHECCKQINDGRICGSVHTALRTDTFLTMHAS
ncbi:MAG: hypothetical protein AYP45_07860 [Candidatus Brocadia carolinensis]|uniref:Uncharacterized protein n=1 Tax=Candidatus Brocadia carolinensis TaxID=1004156 RepID=A0A1V4AU84_9BACT|nr:MAG: hypothetical protein AYP45_07860 [Candidatus Brocadia caroliniensis]